MPVENQGLGKFLKDVRIIRALSLEQTVAMAKAGNQSNLSKMEHGKIVPRPETMEGVSRVYGCPWWSSRHQQQWIRALVWVNTGVPAFRVESATADTMREILQDGQKIVDAYSGLPENDPAIIALRSLSEKLDGVAGLATVDILPTAKAGGFHSTRRE